MNQANHSFLNFETFFVCIYMIDELTALSWDINTQAFFSLGKILLKTVKMCIVD